MLHRPLQAIRDGLLGLMYPADCRVCGNPVESWGDGVACVACWEDVKVSRLTDTDICAKCGLPMGRITSSRQVRAPEIGSRLCGLCSALPYSAARACGVYSGALEASILFLKVNPHICTRLRSLIINTYSKHRGVLTSDVVIPVPLHRLRERRRGFNQAAHIARVISAEFTLRFDDHSLVRIKPTERHRAGLDALDRARSVEQAFSVSGTRLDGMTVLVVDDVYTTGSTICAATRSLLEAGARQVNVLTIARVG